MEGQSYPHLGAWSDVLVLEKLGADVTNSCFWLLELGTAPRALQLSSNLPCYMLAPGLFGTIPSKNAISINFNQDQCFVTAWERAKEILMRVGFEPTPFRTSVLLMIP
jgi:hypothetical protein